MIFMYTADQIIARIKQQTTRLKKPDDFAVRDQFGVIVAIKRQTQTGTYTLYELGQRKAVQRGRGLLGEAFIRITGLRERDRAGDIPESEVKPEGFNTKLEFKTLWQQMYGKLFDSAALEQPVWIIEFRLENLQEVL